MTASEIARRLNLYRPNLSAMDAGRRTVSLKLLGRIAELLSCSPADLIQVEPPLQPFSSQRMLRLLQKKEASFPDGADRSWVHRVLLAWQKHYRAARRKK